MWSSPCFGRCFAGKRDAHDFDIMRRAFGVCFQHCFSGERLELICVQLNKPPRFGLAVNSRGCVAFPARKNAPSDSTESAQKKM